MPKQSWHMGVCAERLLRFDYTAFRCLLTSVSAAELLIITELRTLSLFTD